MNKKERSFVSDLNGAEVLLGCWMALEIPQNYPIIFDKMKAYGAHDLGVTKRSVWSLIFIGTSITSAHTQQQQQQQRRRRQ